MDFSFQVLSFLLSLPTSSLQSLPTALGLSDLWQSTLSWWRKYAHRTANRCWVSRSHQYQAPFPFVVVHSHPFCRQSEHPSACSCALDAKALWCWSSRRISNLFPLLRRTSSGEAANCAVYSKLSLLPCRRDKNSTSRITSGRYHCLQLSCPTTKRPKGSSMASMSSSSTTWLAPWQPGQRFTTLAHFMESPPNRHGVLSWTHKSKVWDNYSSLQPSATSWPTTTRSRKHLSITCPSS